MQVCVAHALLPELCCERTLETIPAPHSRPKTEFARMKSGAGLQRRCWREDLLNHTEPPGARVRRLVCMARSGFRFAVGKPKGRRRAPTFSKVVQDLAPHGEVDTLHFFWNHVFPGSISLAKVRPQRGPRPRKVSK